MTKNRIINIRVTQQDYCNIDLCAADNSMSMSEFVRFAIFTMMKMLKEGNDVKQKERA